MKKVYIIHSRGAHPDDHWYPYVKSVLEKVGFQVHVPQMPNAEAPKQSEWMEALEKYVDIIDEDTYLIGHSVGCQALLRFLDRLPPGRKAGGVVLVAGWVSVPAWEGRTEEQKVILNDWLNPKLNFRKIVDRSKKFTAIFSDNDEFVPKENWVVCEKELHAKVVIKHEAGHFEGTDDLELPEVTDAINDMAK